MEHSHSSKSFFKVKPFECSHCGKKFGYASHLKRHLSLYNGPINNNTNVAYKCNHCECNFTDILYFTRHMSIHLEKVAFHCCGVFQCCYCDMSFSKQNDIIQHMDLLTWKEINQLTDFVGPRNTTFRPELSTNEQPTQSEQQNYGENSNTHTLSETNDDVKEETLEFSEVKKEPLDNVEVKEEQMDIFVQTGIIENNNNESSNVDYIMQDPQGPAYPQETNIHPGLILSQGTTTAVLGGLTFSITVGNEGNKVNKPNLKLQHRKDTQLALQQSQEELMPQEGNTKIIVKNSKSPKNTYKCIDCGRIFLNLSSFQTHYHVKKCTKKNKYKCTNCGQIFLDIISYSTHNRLKACLGKITFKCAQCGEVFLTLITFLEHNRLQPCFRENEDRVRIPIRTKNVSAVAENVGSSINGSIPVATTSEIISKEREQLGRVGSIYNVNDTMQEPGSLNEGTIMDEEEISIISTYNWKNTSFTGNETTDKSIEKHNHRDTKFRTVTPPPNKSVDLGKLRRSINILKKRKDIGIIERKTNDSTTMHESGRFQEELNMANNYKQVDDHDVIDIDDNEKQMNSKTSKTNTVNEPDSFHKGIDLDKNERQMNLKNSEINIASDSDNFIKGKVMHKSISQQSRAQFFSQQESTMPNKPISAYECNQCNVRYRNSITFSKHKRNCDISYNTTERSINSIAQNYTTFRPILKKGKNPVADNARLTYPISNVAVEENILINIYNESDNIKESGIFHKGETHKGINLNEDEIQIIDSKTIKTHTASNPNSNHEEIVMNENDSIEFDDYRHYLKSFKQNSEAFKSNLDSGDMLQGVKMVHHHIKHYNYELGSNVTDHELYQHMMQKYAIVNAQHSIGSNKFNSYHQVTKTWLNAQNEVSTL